MEELLLFLFAGLIIGFSFGLGLAMLFLWKDIQRRAKKEWMDKPDKETLNITKGNEHPEEWRSKIGCWIDLTGRR